MELYIKSLEDPNYDEDQLQIDEDIALIISQIETLIFTEKGDVILIFNGTLVPAPTAKTG